METGQETTSLPDTNRSIVESILAGNSQGAELLYRKYSRGVRYLAARFDSRQATEILHECLAVTTAHIQQGQLRSPDDLPSCVRAALNGVLALRQQKLDRFAAATRRALLPSRNGNENLDRSLEFVETVQEFGRDLQALDAKEREILARTYVNLQNEGDICSQMKLTGMELQFLKALAKQKLANAVENVKDAVRSLAPAAEGKTSRPAFHGEGHAA